VRIWRTWSFRLFSMAIPRPGRRSTGTRSGIRRMARQPGLSGTMRSP